MKNIVLIGMSGAGKSTLGVLLAKAINYKFIDTDLLIQCYTGQKLQETIQEKGIEVFKQIEEKRILSIRDSRTIIATGGSVVYSEQAMKHLKTNAQILYLEVPYDEVKKRLSNISTRGIVMKEGQTLKEVYDEREPLYKKYADIVIEVGQETIEETINKLVIQLEIE